MTRRTPSADAYDLHARYWADSGGDLDFPVDPFKMATTMGISVFTRVLGPRKSGYLTIDPDGSAAIYVNEAHSLNRQRFTVAHEIGHYVDAQATSDFDGLRKTYDRDERAAAGTDQAEVYANRFAAALLMPKLEIERLIEVRMPASDMARRFRVSQESMDWRLRNLGLPRY